MENPRISKIQNIGTESSNEMIYSATSPVGYFGGGGTINLTKLDPKPFFEMLKSGNYTAFFGLINNRIDFNAVDDDGNTILHIFMNNIDKIKTLPTFQNAFKRLLRFVDSATINKQNKAGDTILHIAVKKGEHMIAADLINKGADKNLKNKDGLRIVTSSMKNIKPSNVIEQTPTTIADIVARNAPPIDVDIKSNVNNAVQNFFSKTPPKVEAIEPITESTIGFRSEPITTGGNSIKLLDTESFVRSILNKRKQQIGGDVNNSDTSTGNIDANAVFSATSQTGGRTIIGHRTLAQNDEDDEDDDVHIENEYDDDVDSMDGGKSDKSHIQKLLGNQRDQIHKKTEEKIKSILEKKLGREPTIQEIRDHKSYIYYLVTKNSPELAGVGRGLDRAIEMERLANEEIINNIDEKEFNKIIESKKKHFEEKSAKSSETPKKHKKIKKENSSDISESGSNLTTTSSDEVEDKKKKRKSSKSKLTTTS